MSQEIGSQLPPPLQFELGAHPTGGAPKAVLLLTTDADGHSRVAVLGAPELRVKDASHLEFAVHADSTTGANLTRSGTGALWYVLDAAAYCIRGTVGGSQDPPRPHADSKGHEFQTFELTVVSVLMDFQPSAPMVSGPTYRRL